MPTEPRFKNPLTGEREDSIRTQFVNFFKELSDSKPIHFYGCVVDGAIFSMNFELSWFPSKFTQLDGNTRSSWWSALNPDYIEGYSRQLIDEKVDILVDLINSLPSKYSKSVRIYISQNLGISKNSGVDFGYQYISATGHASEWIPKTTTSTTDRSPSYIDVNLGAENLNFEISKLRYAVLLSLSMERVLDGFYNTRDFNLIIKEDNSEQSDPNYIAIFNSRHLTQFFPIYSNDGAPVSTRIGYSKVNLVGPYSDFLLSSRLSSRWECTGNFIPLWVSSSTPTIKYLEYYKDFITPEWKSA